MALNKKDERVRKLWERGIRDKSLLARKLGFTGEATRAGIERVNQAIINLKLH